MTTRILLTGVTGSFGKAFVDYCLRTSSDVEIYGLSRDECKQASLLRRWAGNPVELILGDVRNPPPLPLVDLVVHAAALKHVVRAEQSPQEFVATNVLGSQNIIEHALACGCPFVVLSTDKACAPTTAYGATKMLMERQALAARGAVVRYGNVLGSRGSLIPFVMQCAQNGKPIPVTSTEMTRFWLHLLEAVKLVIDAWADLKNGVAGVHVPKAPAMGIMELIKALAPKNTTVNMGVMPGEKLHEEMICPDESLRGYAWKNRFLITDAPQPGCELLPHRFSYTSANAPQMTAKELLDKLSNMDLVDNELVIREEPCALQ